MNENELILNNHEFNSSDFALFLSVVKNPKAYKCMLSIFLEESDIELAEVLKSRKETKYKQLPSTVIIFITQEDIL